MPLRFVLPSVASATVLQSRSSIFSAGRTSTRTSTGSSPPLENLWRAPAGTVTTSPGPATIFLPFILNFMVPDTISKRSSWAGCTWAPGT